MPVILSMSRCLFSLNKEGAPLHLSILLMGEKLAPRLDYERKTHKNPFIFYMEFRCSDLPIYRCVLTKGNLLFHELTLTLVGNF